MPIFTMPERSLMMPLSAPRIIGTAPRIVTTMMAATTAINERICGFMLSTLPPTAAQANFCITWSDLNAIHAANNLIGSHKHQDQGLDHLNEFRAHARRKLHSTAACCHDPEQECRWNNPDRSAGGEH